MPTVTHTSDATFAQDIPGEIPALVDFLAEWCGPCRMIAPVLELIATEHSGHLRVVKLNVDENPETARRFGVTGIPTLILFRDGKPVERIVGFRRKAQMLAALQPHLGTTADRRS